MSVFNCPGYDGHEQVSFFTDPQTGLKAIVALHNRSRGPALGGCRMLPYKSDEAALEDVLSLSRTMTYKSALAGLPLGGGKAVIIGDPETDKTPEMMQAMGRFIESLNGQYIITGDTGVSRDDLRLMARETNHITGLGVPTGDQEPRVGDPGPATAYGTYVGIQAAVRFALERTDLEGLKVAIQGVGHVGRCLAQRLRDAGAELWVSDSQFDNLERVADEFGATPVDVDEIYGLDVDVFAPCALGSVINNATLPLLSANIIAGAANNPLADSRQAQRLQERGILYAPDYVINAGGVIDVYYEHIGHHAACLEQYLDGIYDNLMEIFQRAHRENETTIAVADRMAEARLAA